MSPRFIAVPLTLVACFSLAACGSGSAAQSGDSPSTGQSASSPSTPGAVPQRARPETEAGAKAFANYWVKTLNRATTTGQTTKLRDLSADSCSMCMDFAQHLDKIYKRGGHVETKGWDVQSEVPIAGQSKDNPALQLNIKVAPQVVYDSKDAKAKHYDGGTQGFRMFLVRKDDRWLVQRMTL